MKSGSCRRSLVYWNIRASLTIQYASTAVTGIVRIQAQTIRSTTVHLIALNRRAAPTGIDPMSRQYGRCILIALFAGSATSALAEMSAEELAKIAQNPVGNLISVPFQNNTNLNFGPENGTQNVLNIQPVVPISISDD